MTSGGFLGVSDDSEIVRQGLQDLAADIPKVGRQGIYRTAQRIARRLRIYPPEPPNSKYVRTFTLRDAVRIESRPTGYGILVDPLSPQGVEYGIYVLGDDMGAGQAWMHVGRWPPFANVALEEIYQMPADVVDELKLTAAQDGIEVD